MVIAGFVKNSLVDFPGCISSVLFLPGCNFNCFYCHNRQLLQDNYENIDTQTIFDFLQKRKGMIDGVVISGGEPTLHEDLLMFINKIKNIGYKVKLDTNGSSPDIIKQILQEEVCDYYAVDYKAPKDKYKDICGENANADDTLKTISILAESGIDFEVRTTVFPHLTKEDLMNMATELPLLPRYVLNRYKKPALYMPQDKILIEHRPYTQKELTKLAESIRAIQPNITT